MTAVVIGAGPAGLSAAYELLNSAGTDWHVIVVEASHAIGGLARTFVHEGNRFDLGPHRFFSKVDEINALWEQLLPLQGSPSKDDLILNRQCSLRAGGPNPEKIDRVMLRRSRLTRIYYRRRFLDYPISLKLATFMAMGFVRSAVAGLSFLWSSVFKRRETSLEDFYVNRFGKVLYSIFFEDYTEKLWGVHPSCISPEWGAQRVKGLSLWKALLNVFGIGRKETSLIDEFSYPKLGSGQFWEVMAEKIRTLGGEIRLGFPVTRLECELGRVTAVVSQDGERIPCDALFSSMPISDLVAAFTDVPPSVAEVAQNLPYRDLITVNLSVDRLAVGNDTKLHTIGPFIPDVWIYIQDRRVRMGRLEIYNNFSPYLVRDPANNVWVAAEYFCTKGDAIWSRENPELVDMCVQELRSLGLLSEDTPVRSSVCIRAEKAYPAYFGSYSRFTEVRDWLDGYANLFCIGRNGQHRYNNMDHSMLCGIEAARALVRGTDKSVVWSVNTEKEYHEAKVTS